MTANEEIILEMLGDGLAVSKVELKASVEMKRQTFENTMKNLHKKGLISVRKGIRNSCIYKIKHFNPFSWVDYENNLYHYLLKNCFKRKLLQGEHI